MTALTRHRGPDCASDLTLDRLALDELSEVDRARVLAHLTGCAACTQASAALDADRAAFAAEAAVPTLAAEVLERATARSRRRLIPWVALPAALAAIGAALVVIAPAPRPYDTRAKGTFSLSVYVQHRDGDGAGTLHMGEPLHPGDRIQFRYNGDRAGHLAVFGVDADGQVSTYYPPGAQAPAVHAGREVPLETAVELDDSLGREVIVALRCDEPHAVARLKDAVLASVARTRQMNLAPTDMVRLTLPCAEVRHTVTKEAVGSSPVPAAGRPR